MKVLLFLLLVGGKCFSQDSLMYGVFPVSDGRVSYTYIISDSSLSKDKFYVRVKEWAVNSFRSQKSTLESEDKEAGFIAFKSYYEVEYKYKGGIFKGKAYNDKIYNTLKFYIKNGRVKIVLTDILVESDGYSVAFGLEADKTPIELFEDEVNRREKNKYISKKKADKWRATNREDYLVLDAALKNLLEVISKELTKNKSEFDF